MSEWSIISEPEDDEPPSIPTLKPDEKSALVVEVVEKLQRIVDTVVSRGAETGYPIPVHRPGAYVYYALRPKDTPKGYTSVESIRHGIYNKRLHAKTFETLNAEQLFEVLDLADYELEQLDE